MSELCVWDLDGTLRPGFLMGDAIAHAADMGLVDISVFANPSAPDYQELHHFMAAVTAQPRNVFGNLMDRLSEEATTQIYPWAHERIETQVKEGLHPIIVSQSPAFLVKAFARGITGVQHARGSYLETKELKFTGKASSLDKMRAALRYAYEHGLPREFAYAAGDSLSDVPILKLAKAATVVNPTPQLSEIASQRGWEIIAA